MSQDNDDYKFNFFKNNNLTEFNDKNVIYLGYIGKHNEGFLFKYGKTNRIFERNKEHQSNFNKFELVSVQTTDNNDKIEKLFEKELIMKNKHLTKKIKNKIHKELFFLENINEIDDYVCMLKEIIDNNKLPIVQELEEEIKKKDEEINKLNDQLKSKKKKKKHCIIS